MIYLQIIFIVVLAALVFTLFKYSQEGDILTFTNSSPKLKEMKEKYQTRDEIVERLHSLLIYKESYVKWNRFLVISMFASLVTLYSIRGDVKLPEFILLTCFSFLCIDLPNRWGYTHISKGIIQQATRLYTYHHSLEK